MKRKHNLSPIVLPARMSLKSGAFENFEIAVFDFPYEAAINNFLAGLKNLLRKEWLEWWQYPPYRLLNSAIVACAPTVVHGFEKDSGTRCMLAVGKPIYDEVGTIIGSTLHYPTEEQIGQLIQVWAQVWGQEPWLKKLIEGEAKGLWNNLIQALQTPPQTRWRKIKPTVFSSNLYAEKNLAFKAIPSLLATLLHNELSLIGGNKREVRWRKAQDDSNRLCIVSYPLPISFMRKSGFTEKSYDSYFAYKLEFQVHTQTGREEPWIHVFLRCQRYAEKPLTRNRKGNNVTLLMGMNQSRIDGWEIDSTLVRLKANKYLSENYVSWEERLPVLLENFRARSLAGLFSIYQNPQAFWNHTKKATSSDEYYVIHTEGYEYKRSKHSVMTGFGLAERSEIIDLTCCDLLKDVLKPDKYFEPDPLTFDEIPRASWTFSDLVKRPPLLSKAQAAKQGLSDEQRYQYREQETEERRKQLQHIPIESVRRALDGKKLATFILYRHEDTRKALHQQLRESFLLNEDDPFPQNIIVIDQPVLDPELCQPLNPGDLSPKIRNQSKSRRPEGFDNNWDERMRNARFNKLKAWRELLRNAAKNLHNMDNVFVTTLIELSEEPESGDNFHKSQGIKGVVREACARENFVSQIIYPVDWKTNKATGELFLPDDQKGRAQNAVQEVVMRQIGGMYDSPAGIYQQVGISQLKAGELDVIAFCLRTTQMGVRYGLAVRLGASGKVDVLLPKNKVQTKLEWLSYAEVGSYLGRLFAESRKDLRKGKIFNASDICLSTAALVEFVEETLIAHLEHPTLVIIEADNWRTNNQGGWTQLQNSKLSQAMNCLEFGNERFKDLRTYHRDDAQLNNLLGVIRIRTGDETPQYITNRETWRQDGEKLTRDLYSLSGYVDSSNDVFHYFSIGRLPNTVKGYQSKKRTEDPYKSDDGGGIPFKHQQMVEMVPFFVHPEFQSKTGLIALCRVPHYLRSSPAWTAGNLVHPYPMHLGQQLVEDQICILGIDN
jgi:hypothetical protein